MKRVDEARTQYVEAYQSEPIWASYAPGRVNLIGEHVDYHGGPVFPLAIDRGVTVVAGPSGDVTKAVSAGYRNGRSFRMAELSSSTPIVSWSKYVAGAAWAVGAKTDLLLSFVSDLPTGSGLSSSAAIEVSVATLANMVDGLALDRREIALSCQRAENDYVGMPCGIMDQMASVFGRGGMAMVIDTGTLEIQYERLPDDVAVVVCETGVRHNLGDSGYPDRRRASEEAAGRLGVRTLSEAKVADVEELSDPVLKRRARHVVTEIARVKEFASALESGDRPEVFRLMRDSHASLRDDYEVSCPELDEMAESCWAEPSCWGARMTGGGFGGACVALVELSKTQEFVANVEQNYKRRVKRSTGSFLICQASAGAESWQL